MDTAASLTTVDHGGGGGTTISAVHPDILQTHILTRLDGPTLASAASTSSQLCALSSQDHLWRYICNDKWPSTAHPRVRRLISSFPSAHRSFFSDSFPSLDHRHPLRRSPPNRRRTPPPPSQLFSAVDLHYQTKPVLSKALATETITGLMLGADFRIDLLDPKETVPMPVNLDFRDDTCESDLEENLTLSWIVIDPVRNRAANFSSFRPVSVDRNWLTGDIELRYVTVLSGDRRGEVLQCCAIVTCGGREGGGLDVREVSLQVEDMEGKNLGWEESLVILLEAVEGGKRRIGKRGEEKEGYEMCLKMKKERSERKKRRQKRLEVASIVTAVTIFVAFWVFVVIRILQFLHLV
ncbi:hypothetical protein HYC85_025113 [Camellia sinensis]|uniref:F-box domain-containing protein n=1 Tax=Camellia sinensis TaxID=4442 RepID=A0A7J7GAJ6_CAMSI|nr:hypothetical protein HYC85_025113 [Camellia sinensis]